MQNPGIRNYVIFCIILCVLLGCSGPSEGKSTRETDPDRLEINLICKFLKLEPGEKGLPALGILCVSKVPVSADIGYQVNNSKWIPIEIGKKAEKIGGQYIVRYRWEKPDISKNEIMIKVTAVSSDGKKRTMIKAVDCVKPASKATFNPFSL